MKIFVPNESERGETRVALVPAAIKRLGLPGVEILIESQAGMAASHGDEAYQAVGAKIVTAAAWAEADVVLVVGPPTPAQVRQMRAGPS